MKTVHLMVPKVKARHARGTPVRWVSLCGRGDGGVVSLEVFFGALPGLGTPVHRCRRCAAVVVRRLP